jgi:hypothetical protein
MKKGIRLVGLVLRAMAASADNIPGIGGTTNNADPATVIWAIVAVMGGMATAFFAMSLIWTSIQGAVSDHEHFHKLPKIFFWGAICFSATFLAGRMALGA